MPKDIFPQTTPDLVAMRKKLAPHIHDAFTAFSEHVFAEGALQTKIKQLIAVGATAEEIMEAVWVAAEMRAGGAYAHSIVTLDTIEESNGRTQRP